MVAHVCCNDSHFLLFCTCDWCLQPQSVEWRIWAYIADLLRRFTNLTIHGMRNQASVELRDELYMLDTRWHGRIYIFILDMSQRTKICPDYLQDTRVLARAVSCRAQRFFCWQKLHDFRATWSPFWSIQYPALSGTIHEITLVGVCIDNTVHLRLQSSHWKTIQDTLAVVYRFLGSKLRAGFPRLTRALTSSSSKKQIDFYRTAYMLYMCRWLNVLWNNIKRAFFLYSFVFYLKDKEGGTCTGCTTNHTEVCWQSSTVYHFFSRCRRFGISILVDEMLGTFWEGSSVSFLG